MKKAALIAIAGALLAAGQSFGFTTTYTSSGNNIDIPDNDPNGITFDIVVNDNFVIGDLNVGLIITHSYQGDIIASIEHVGFGGPRLLINRPGVPETNFGFSADNFGHLAAGLQYVLDDIAPNYYDISAVPMPGITNINNGWRPDEDLAYFNGQNAAGIWRLRVSDNAQDDTGSLRTFALIFETVPGPGALAAFGLAGLMRPRRRR